MIFTVSNSDELVAAFQVANGGDRIELLGGEYDAVPLKNRDFDANVTITSADASDPAIFRGALTITDVSQVTISDVTFAPDGTALDILDLLLLRDSQFITLHSSTFTGHIPQAGEGLSIAEDIDTRDEAKGPIEGQAFARGIRLDSSDNISITGNDFSNLRKGIILDTVQEIEISGNHLHDLRSDGINLVDAVSVTIAENLMESFSPLHNYDNLAYADHGDFIQWWAGSGGLGIRDLTIRDNALLQGAGSWVQGIFGRSGSANEDGSPAEFSGIRITNNLINTSHPNGIFVGDARDVEITGNTLLPAPLDLTQPVITSGIPSIQIRTSATHLGGNEYDFSSEGALPQDVLIERNVTVGDTAFTSYQIDPGLYAALNISAADNEVFSSDPSDAGFWGIVYPELVADPLSALDQLSGGAGNAAGFDPDAVPAALAALLADPSRQTERVQNGTAEDDVLQADGSGRILDGGAGADSLNGTASSDVIRGGTGSDEIETGAGADKIAFHRQDLAEGDTDAILDLDFDAGDYIVFSGGFGVGFFDDTADESNALTTFGSGDSAVIHDLADLSELVAQDQISAHDAGPGAVELRFDLDGDIDPDWTLRLHGISDIGETLGILDSGGQTLIGTTAADSLVAGTGDDVLHANGGDDHLTGGAGADVFRIDWGALIGGTHLQISDLNFDQGDLLVLENVSWSPPSHTDLIFNGLANEISILSTDGLSALSASAFVALEQSMDDRTIVHFTDAETSGYGSVLDLGDLSMSPSSTIPGVLAGTASAEVLRGRSDSADQIFGGGGDDLLDGRAGADAMFGGLGDDRYYVDTGSDHVTEVSDQGYDRVYTLVDYALSAFTEAITARGSDDLRLTGNAHDNWMTGNGGNNALIGRDGADRLIGRGGDDWLDGGAGGDVMQGGQGNDRYVVDSWGDHVIENENEGYDRVYTSIDYHLGAGVEALAGKGTADTSLFGNEIANWLTGNSGNNFISGGEGADRLIGRDGDDHLSGDAGSDVLAGGAGRDVFAFKSGDGADVITDFEAGSDMLLIDVISADMRLEASETNLGVIIRYGDAGDTVVLNGMTQAILQSDSPFAAGAAWVLDF